jgi:predicted amidohydrolase
MCSEVYVPEVARALALRGAELIFMPAGKDKGRLWATWRALIWARAIENLAIVVTTQNLFDHSERGLAMVAGPEEVLFESTIAGTTVVDVSLERVRYLRDPRRGGFLRALRGQAGPARAAMAAAGALRPDPSASLREAAE